MIFNRKSNGILYIFFPFVSIILCTLRVNNPYNDREIISLLREENEYEKESICRIIGVIIIYKISIKIDLTKFVSSF